MNESNPQESNFEQVIARAYEVFEDRDNATGWLQSPIPALGGRIPIEVAGASTEGCAEILAELTRIEHGVFA